MSKDAQKAAETSIFLASSSNLENITGEYFVDNNIKKSSKQSYDMNVAKRLWELSIKYVDL